MKKLSKSILLSLVALLLASMPVLAAVAYRAAYTIVESDGNAYDMLATFEGVDNQWMADNGFMQPNALDTRIETLGGLQRPHMVAQNKTLTATAVPANSQTNLYFTTANADLPSMDIIEGNDGFVTIPDDATLELGSNFEIEQSGYVDTDAGSDKNLVYKDTAYRTYISAEDEITSAIAYGSPVFPTVEAVNGGNDLANLLNHTVNLPAGIVADELLLVVFTSDGNEAIGWPGGWVELFEEQLAACTLAVGYRIADGSEGATITVTTGNAQMTSHTSYRISGYFGVPEVGAATNGNSNIPDPPNLAPSWGARSTLWFAVVGYNDGRFIINAYPVNYTDGRLDRSNDVEGVGTGSARRELNAAAENPGTFTLQAAGIWVANTIAIGPAELEVTATGIPSGEYTVNTSLNATAYDFSDYNANTTVAVSMGGGLIPVILLEEQELTAAAASVTFSNIDTLVAEWDLYGGVTSRHLVIMVNGAMTAAPSRTLQLQFNSDAGNNYNSQILYGVGGADGADPSTGVAYIHALTLPGTTYADGYGGGVVLIPHAFNAVNHKSTLSIFGAVEDSIYAATGRWANTDAIISLDCLATTDNFAIGSTFWLGVVDERYLVEEAINPAVDFLPVFAAIPQDGSDLCVIGYASSDDAGAVEDEVLQELNTDNIAANYPSQQLDGRAGATNANQVNQEVAMISSDLATANAFGAFYINYSQYAEEVNDPHFVSLSGYHETTGPTSEVRVMSGRWDDAGLSAITQIELYPNTGANFLAGSLFSLYRVPRTVIDRQELAAPAATITFADIPQGYEALQVLVYTQTSAIANRSPLAIDYNNDAAGANYDYQYLQGLGAAVNANRAVADPTVGLVAANNLGANVWGGAITTIPNYAKADRHKHSYTISGSAQDSVNLYSNRWEDTDPITEIDLYLTDASNFVAGSIFELVGIFPQDVFAIEVDGDLYDIADGNNVSVLDNANDWILNQNNVMPYMDYYKASGQAPHFTGANDSNVNCGAIHNDIPKLWVSLWFELDNDWGAGAGSGDIYLWGKLFDGTHRVYVDLVGDGTIHFFFNDGGVNSFTLVSTTDRWIRGVQYHVLASLSDTAPAQRLIINGVVEDTDIIAASNTPNGGVFVFANYGDPGGVASGVPGKVFNVVIGTDDLTIAEELGLFNGTIPADANNIWYADEGVGVNIVDYGTDGDDGTADAAVTWVGSGNMANNDALARVWYQPNDIVESTDFDGTETAGGSATIVTDNTMGEAPGYWVGALVTITEAGGAAPEGEARVCTVFAAGGVITVAPAFSANVDIGDDFTIDFGTLVDRAPSDQDARITWGVNPTGIAVTLGGMVNAGQPIPGALPSEPAQDVLLETPVTDWYEEPDVAGVLLTNPLRPFVTMWSDNTGLTEIQCWRLYALALILLVTVSTALSVGRHQGITAIMASVAILGAVVMTIFPMWTLVFAIGMFIGGLVMERSPSL